MPLRDRILATRFGYSTFRRVILADRSMARVVADHIRPAPGSRLLDIGCGPGDLAGLVPEVSYVGVDHNPAYLDAAAAEPPAAGPWFVNADLADLAALDIGTFDTTVALGVLHHLDDDLARAVARDARDLIREGGRFISVDPVFHPDQRSIARVLMALDRGRYVRHPADYARIVRSAFDDVDVTIRHDLLPFPYTHCILTASVSSASERHTDRSGGRNGSRIR